MKRSLILAVGLLLASVSFAYAQNPVVTRPQPTNTISNNSSLIDTTNTFKTVFPASTDTTGRIDCVIQNLSSRDMFISFETTPTLTTNALTLPSKVVFYCANSGVVNRNKISITGTASDRYFAIQY